MDPRPILFFDTGIGGLPYYRDFHLRNPGEALVYTADRANFPYGPKSREQVISLLRSLMAAFIARFNPKIMVLACNTASVSALSGLREDFPQLPFVGTVPAVKPAVMESRTRRVGVLGTERTIKDPYIAELAAHYGPDCTLRGIAAPELVEFAERRSAAADTAERLGAVTPCIDEFRSTGVDGVVLGCTHFLLLLDEFRLAAGEDIRVYDSVDGVTRRVEALLDAGGAGLRAPGQNSVQRTPESGRLWVTGEAPIEDSWRTWADHFGLSLGRL
jgi:glutamate racemase